MKNIEQKAIEYSELLPFIDDISKDNSRLDFIAGAKYHKEISFSEEDMRDAFYASEEGWVSFDHWLKQFNKNED